MVEVWKAQSRRILEAVGWAPSVIGTRAHRGGLTLAFTAPIDALYAATEVNEWAFAAAQAILEGSESSDFETAVARLRAEIRAESNPLQVALIRAAAQHGVTCLSDDDEISLGLGAGSITWPAGELPASGDVDWSKIHDVPVALITGTNGKSTTVRLLASMIEAAGKVGRALQHGLDSRRRRDRRQGGLLGPRRGAPGPAPPWRCRDRSARDRSRWHVASRPGRRARRCRSGDQYRRGSSGRVGYLRSRGAGSGQAHRPQGRQASGSQRRRPGLVASRPRSREFQDLVQPRGRQRHRGETPGQGWQGVPTARAANRVR